MIKCRTCQYLSQGISAEKGSWNSHLPRPRMGFSCEHPLAEANHENLLPRSRRMRGFIGFSENGELLPAIRTHTRWCPRKIGEYINKSKRR